MTTPFPAITVLMPTYNGAKHIRTAIDSVLSQTFSDFELLIVNDGSGDDTLKVINSYNDNRIRIVTNEVNIGITKSLNRGLKEARGEYIARLDDDDIALPERLQKQCNFLNTHQDVVLVGSFVEYIDKNGNPIRIRKTPIKPRVIQYELIYANCFYHSALMFRKEEILSIGGYNEDFKHAQDYELFSRLRDGYKLANIPEVLIQYRMNPDSIVASPASQEIVHANALATIRKLVAQHTNVTDEEFDVFINAIILKTPKRILSVKEIFRAHAIHKKIFSSYTSQHPQDRLLLFPHYRRRRNLMIRKLASIKVKQWLRL